MAKMIINKEKIGDIEVEVMENYLWCNFQNNSYRSELIIISDGIPAIKFRKEVYVETLKANVGGFKITQEQKDEITKQIEVAKLNRLESEVQEFLNKKQVRYHTSYDFFLPEKLKSVYSKKTIRLAEKHLEENCECETDMGDYSISYTYKITGEQLVKILNEKQAEVDLMENEAKAEKQAELDTKIQEAKDTGKDVEIARWSDDCNDSSEACDVDIVVKYIRADGTTYTKRHHTW